jgi:4-aminobutyrate aminotransferase-like enzyme
VTPRLLASMLAPGERPSMQAVSGRGTRLTLADGRIVIDAGSMSSCLLGHCHPEIVAAVQSAATAVYVNDTVGFEPREQAAQDILGIAFEGERWADSVALFVSASEAVDLGLELAQILTGRKTLVSRQGSYHGAVGLAREVSQHPLWGAALASPSGGVWQRPRLADTRRLPAPICGRVTNLDGHDCRTTCLAGATEALANSAAVIMDYSQGGTVPSAQYQDVLAEAARKAGALWIADETVTGLGRMGRGFAFQRGDSRPDMVTMGKGLTGGAAAAGALILSRGMVDAIDHRRWMTGSTFRGHPLAVAAMSAVIAVIHRDELVERAARLGAGLGCELRSICASHPSVREVVGEGLLWFIQLAEPDPGWTEDAWAGDGEHVALSQIVSDAVLERGVIIPAFSGERLWLVPPLVISEAELSSAAEALDHGLTVADRVLEAIGALP